MSDVFVPNVNILPEMPPDAPATPAPTAPSSIDQARARRDAIINDPVWSANYKAGDLALRQEMRTLNMLIAGEQPADVVGAILAGTAAPGTIVHTDDENFLTTSDLMSAIDGLRKDGFADETIKAILAGEPVTPERHREAAIIKERVLRDKEWIRQYRLGYSENVQQMRNLNAVLSAPIAEAK